MAESIPEAGTNLSPTFRSTPELPTGGIIATQYTSPSQLYSFDDPFIPTDYTKVSRLEQAKGLPPLKTTSQTTEGIKSVGDKAPQRTSRPQGKAEDRVPL